VLELLMERPSRRVRRACSAASQRAAVTGTAGTARRDPAALADLVRRGEVSPSEPGEAATGKTEPEDMSVFLPTEK
jgi:hypothetical protein